MADKTVLPNPHCYITDNDENGGSFFARDVNESLPVVKDLGGALMRLGYTTDRPPVQLTNGTDLVQYTAAHTDIPPLVTPAGGANVWYIDTPPETESPMHRTVSLDFVILVSGEIELSLSSGETRLVKPGDLVVQRSTLHKWRNPSKTNWARMVGIMAACQPVVTKNGSTLGEDFPEP